MEIVSCWSRVANATMCEGDGGDAFSAILRLGWQRGVPSHGISVPRERGSGIPWFSRALFWEWLVQSPGSETYKFGTVAHFLRYLLLRTFWLNRIRRTILGTGSPASSESLFSTGLPFPWTNFFFQLAEWINLRFSTQTFNALERLNSVEHVALQLGTLTYTKSNKFKKLFKQSFKWLSVRLI